jgi:hypothetical protein
LNGSLLQARQQKTFAPAALPGRFHVRASIAIARAFGYIAD